MRGRFFRRFVAERFLQSSAKQHTGIAQLAKIVGVTAVLLVSTHGIISPAHGPPCAPPAGAGVQRPAAEVTIPTDSTDPDFAAKMDVAEEIMREDRDILRVLAK